MLFQNDRDALRRTYHTAWQRYRAQQPLEPLQHLIVEVILLHPEYHTLIESEDALTRDYLPDAGAVNPYLHMGMHIALREQFSADRPTGIHTIYQALAARHSDPHVAEHEMMQCLGEALWQAHRDGRDADETGYLECLQRLAGQGRSVS